MAKDPVCGMEVSPDKAAARSEYAGQTYLFCCQECARKFNQSPSQYAKPAAQTSRP